MVNKIERYYSNSNLFFGNEIISKLFENNTCKNNKYTNLLNLKSNFNFNNNNHTIKKSKNLSTLYKEKSKTENLKEKINYKRPKSSLFKIRLNKNKTTKNKVIIDDDYFDISYIYNNKKNNNIYNNKIIKKYRNEINKSQKENEIKKAEKGQNDINEIKKEIREKIMNLKLRKKNTPKMFIRRPIPTVNDKYLLYLPKEIKKDIKNKYNFFSFILTDDLYSKYNQYPIKHKSFKKKKTIKILSNSKIQEIKRNKNINNKEDKLFKTGCTNTNTNMNSFYKLYKPVRLKKEFDLKKNMHKNNNEEIDINQGIKSVHFYSYKYKNIFNY